MRRLFALYLLIGLLVAAIAWDIDTSPMNAKVQAWPVMVLIVVLWPLWLLIQFLAR
jgi:hypothetical protein